MVPSSPMSSSDHLVGNTLNFTGQPRALPLITVTAALVVMGGVYKPDVQNKPSDLHFCLFLRVCSPLRPRSLLVWVMSSACLNACPKEECLPFILYPFLRHQAGDAGLDEPLYLFVGSFCSSLLILL